MISQIRALSPLPPVAHPCDHFEYKKCNMYKFFDVAFTDLPQGFAEQFAFFIDIASEDDYVQ